MTHPDPEPNSGDERAEIDQRIRAAINRRRRLASGRRRDLATRIVKALTLQTMRGQTPDRRAIRARYQELFSAGQSMTDAADQAAREWVESVLAKHEANRDEPNR